MKSRNGCNASSHRGNFCIVVSLAGFTTVSSKRVQSSLRIKSEWVAIPENPFLAIQNYFVLIFCFSFSAFTLQDPCEARPNFEGVGMLWAEHSNAII